MALHSQNANAHRKQLQTLSDIAWQYHLKAPVYLALVTRLSHCHLIGGAIFAYLLVSSGDFLMRL
ncbi:MAG: hypothetical protein AAF921_27970 [Cyanobacteria bacterium P01_D01_bin.44]